MRSPDSVFWRQVQQIEEGHLREEITLNDAVRLLVINGMSRYEAYLRLESAAVRESEQHARNQAKQA